MENILNAGTCISPSDLWSSGPQGSAGAKTHKPIISLCLFFPCSLPKSWNVTSTTFKETIVNNLPTWKWYSGSLARWWDFEYERPPSGAGYRIIYSSTCQICSWCERERWHQRAKLRNSMQDVNPTNVWYQLLKSFFKTVRTLPLSHVQWTEQQEASKLECQWAKVIQQPRIMCKTRRVGMFYLLFAVFFFWV